MEIAKLPWTKAKGKTPRHGNRQDVATRASGGVDMPRTSLDMVRQAATAVSEADRCGCRRQAVQFLLPINQRRSNFLSTEPIDYPCSLYDEYRSAVHVVQSTLDEVDDSRNVGTMQLEEIGTAGVEGEPAAILRTSSNTHAAMVFPVSDQLDKLRKLDADCGKETLMVVNPQWNLTKGNLVSDFGIGPWRRKAEEFLATFEPVYVLEEHRIGAPGSLDPISGDVAGRGGVVRLLKVYNAPWLLYLVQQGSGLLFLGEFQTKPTYKDMEAAIGALKSGDYPSARSELARGNYTGKDGRQELLANLTPEQIDAMDKKSLQVALQALRLPTSGKLSKLKERLLEALKER
uniref:DUF1995 domain-containing protein n=1 Tax=Picocystis salinarum TaxID=88271 RepID=A0A6U9QJH0_9CHLO